MSESNGEPPSNPPASASEPAGGGLASNNVTRAPRANPPTIYNQKETPPETAPPGFSEFMNLMKAMGANRAPTEEAAPVGRPLIPKEQKKFSRRTTEPVKPTEVPDNPATTTLAPPSSSSEATAEKPAPTAAPNVPADLLNIERKRRSKDTSPQSPGVRLALQGLVFALIVASFFVGRATVPKAAPVAVVAAGEPVTSKDGSEPGLLPDNLLAKIDEALAAESAGDTRRANELLQSVKDGGAQVRGLDYHLALLNFSNGELARVLPQLNQSIAKGEEVAACYNLRGTLANRQGGVNRGIADLELASKIDPFNARYAFFLGEALRRRGQPQAALVALRQAYHRLREPALEGMYLLKIRLAELELGQAADFSAELAVRLAATPPPLDWVLTAAAVELHRGNMPAAAEYLEKAHNLVPERELLMRLRDFYFYGFSDRKELEKYFAPLKAVPLLSSTAATPTGIPFEQGAPSPSPSLLDAPNPVNLIKTP